MTKKGIALLRKVEKVILDDPKKFDMGRWATVFDKTAKGYNPRNKTIVHNSCGTVGCIAGWTCLLADKKTQKKLTAIAKQNTKGDVEAGMDEKRAVGRASLSRMLDPQKQALSLLGIDAAQASKLFHESNWPLSYFLESVNAPTPKARAKIAVARIEHFIKTNGAE